jgi:hypothetical protein
MDKKQKAPTDIFDKKKTKEVLSRVKKDNDVAEKWLNKKVKHGR